MVPGRGPHWPEKQDYAPLDQVWNVAIGTQASGRSQPISLGQFTPSLARVQDWCDRFEIPKPCRSISLAIAPGVYAVALLDQAGGHMTGKLEVPGNISIIPLPTNRPELN